MGTEKIREREHQLVSKAFEAFRKIPGVHILADNVEERLGVLSFYIENIHFNLVVKLLSDRFGIQVRGGCACAGTYGHYLLDVSHDKSRQITELINHGDLSQKPGWIRASLHPTMTCAELDLMVEAVSQIAKNAKAWEQDYVYNRFTNEFRHHSEPEDKTVWVEKWFELTYGTE
jgi:selenocysteine lyase/cysteine desulfurase